MVTKVVRKDKSAAAVKANKKAKQYRQKNKGKLNAKAKRAYATMKPKDKLKHLERQVFTKAMRHGATEAEAEKAVKAYKLRRKQRAAGKHASAKIGAARNAQREVRNNIRTQAAHVRDAHRAALAKIKSAGGTPAQRSKMRQAEKKRYAKDRSKLASLRKKAVGKHKTLLTNIKKKSKPFRLQDFISNYSKTPLSRKGKRLKNVDPTAAIANKHFTGKTGGAKKKSVTKRQGAKSSPAVKATEAAAPKKRGRPSKSAVAAMNGNAAPHGVKKDGTPAKKRGRPAKAKPAETAAAPAPKKRGRPAKAKPAETAAAPAPKKRGRPAKAKPAETAVAPAPKKRGRPAKAKTAEAAPATTAAPKKRGRPAGSKNKAKETAAPVKAAAAKAAKAPAKKAAKAAAKPVAKAAAKAAAKPAAKAAAKPVAKKEAAKVAAKVATKVATKTAAKKGGAVPKKSSNRKATLS